MTNIADKSFLSSKDNVVIIPKYPFPVKEDMIMMSRETEDSSEHLRSSLALSQRRKGGGRSPLEKTKMSIMSRKEKDDTLAAWLHLVGKNILWPSHYYALLNLQGASQGSDDV